MKLTAANLSAIASRVPVPGYDRSKLRAGIVHIGVGGFHRAHQAMYLDALLSESDAFGESDASQFAIIGVGVRPEDEPMRDTLREQSTLYTLVEKEADRPPRPRVIGSMIDYLFAPDDPEAVLTALTDPAIRIVSLTITEGGYHVNQTTGEFEADAAVLTEVRDGAQPTSTFGFLTEALARRRAAGIEPFTVLSCDNLPQNGRVAQRTLSAFASLKDEELGEWINQKVSFPSSMVDRITPVTSPLDRRRLLEEFGVKDSWPVMCEPFCQWVVEDRFPSGRPALERVGVQFVDDVEPYELMKLRLLNAGHQTLCYLGYLAGYRFAHEVCRDPSFVRFVRAYMEEEATPTLEPVPGVDLPTYKTQLIERFSNPEISDTLSRLCADASDRIPKFLLPVVHARLAAGKDVRRSALVVASWARYAQGVDEWGRQIDVVDRRRTDLANRAARQLTDPLAFLEDETLFGDLRYQPAFVEPYVKALDSLHSIGARATVEQWEGRL
ncbi:mannitol dehydrogenase family protein [Streptosporangium sp. NBC_01756]|uniref:mannitol dehydrogenase family protein n=1 Tax=Streptosporangium sp. NBC_01756 TaxID=2975950 RepID=UPI002DDC69B1|nr:mannitol dehydrogenase family protein [Streptosporangium sp. NBC_01756]WSC87864.1 mannitol dehydrogenase family protein [Streptosporangium sp. NBC_01756]